VAHEEVLLFGGVSGVGAHYGVLNDMWTWNGSLWSEQRSSPTPSARLGCVMDFDAATGTVVTYGGMAFEPPNQVLGDTWLWNGSAWSQRL
jgi:hypothetical protein